MSIFINFFYLDLDEEIINHFKLNKNKEQSGIDKIYSNSSIYLINYPENKDVVVSYGQPPKLGESKIQHYCTTKEGSSGSPILLINNQKLIGIHWGSYKNFNKGTLLLYSIIEFEDIKNNLLLIDKEGKIIDNNENNDFCV